MSTIAGDIVVRTRADVGDLQSDMKRGATAVKEFGNETLRAAQKARSAGGNVINFTERLRSMGRMSRETQFQLRNVGFQVQDFAVQVAGGTSATRAFSQQFPQLVSGMGLWGAAIGTAAAVGLPLFAAAMSNASQEADELRTKLEGIAQATREAERQYEQFLSGARTREEADALKLVEEAHAAVAQQIKTVNATHRAESKVIQEGILAQLREELQVRQDALAKIQNALNKLDQVKEVTESSASAARALRAALESNIGPLDGMIARAREFGETLREAAGIRAQGEATYGGGRGGDPRQFTHLDEFRGQLQRQSRLGSARSARGGGGGGGSAPDRSGIESLIDSLRTEREVIVAWYEESQSLLAQANAAELAAIGGHNEAKVRLEQEYQERIAGIRGAQNGTALQNARTFFGQMAQAVQAGGEKTFRATQVFSAAEGIINSYLAGTQVLKDPSLPFHQKIPAAAAVLANGLSMVNAIRGASTGGGGGAVSAATTPSVSRVANIQLVGDTFSQSSVRDLFEEINQGLVDGYRINLVGG